MSKTAPVKDDKMLVEEPTKEDPTE